MISSIVVRIYAFLHGGIPQRYVMVVPIRQTPATLSIHHRRNHTIHTLNPALPPTVRNLSLRF